MGGGFRYSILIFLLCQTQSPAETARLPHILMRKFAKPRQHGDAAVRSLHNAEEVISAEMSQVLEGLCFCSSAQFFRRILFLGHFGSSSWALCRAATFLNILPLSGSLAPPPRPSGGSSPSSRLSDVIFRNPSHHLRGGRADMTYGAGRGCQTGPTRLGGVDEWLGGKLS